MISGSGKGLEFQNLLLGNELGAWNGTAFVAQVDGIYNFNIRLSTRYNSRNYRLRALINNGDAGVDQLNENSARYQTNSEYGHTHSFQIEREMRVGDSLTIVDQYTWNNQYLHDFDEYKCSTNQQEHSCSHITGRLIKRI